MTIVLNISLLFGAIALGLIGAALLALSQDKHWRVVTGSAPKSSRRLARQIGWGIAILILPLCIARDGASFGALLWPLILQLSAVGIAIIIATNPAWLKPLSIVLQRPEQ